MKNIHDPKRYCSDHAYKRHEHPNFYSTVLILHSCLPSKEYQWLIYCLCIGLNGQCTAIFDFGE